MIRSLGLLMCRILSTGVPPAPVLVGLLLLEAGLRLEAQTPRPSDFVVDLEARPSATAPYLRLSWSQRLQGNITAQRIHRRLKGDPTWIKLADLGLTTTNFSDATAAIGVEYEYWLERTLNATPVTVMPQTAMGYLSAGIRVPALESRGTLLLVLDQTLLTPLAPEINQLVADLAGDGWNVVRIPVARTASVPSVKALIQAAYEADPENVRMVYLFGHVPVPYSGNNAPDGHANHMGAWSADGYYGDMDGVWTDVTVNSVGASNPRNHNVPGDGKFDQSLFPSPVELAVGRVDLSGLTKAPTAAVTEVDLMRRYLAKAHAYRFKTGAYTAIPRRTLVYDALTAWMTGLTPLHWSSSTLGRPPLVPIDVALSGQWFSTNYAGGKNYLLGYSGGYSGYESTSGLGSTTDFGTRPNRVVFMGMFGSYFGDWDSPNNLMRAVLAGNATGDSLALASFWAGTPHYFMHHMGMGETIGYSIRASQNGPIAGGTSLLPGAPRWGSSPPFGGTHTGLMGDPALRLHVVEPPRNLSVSSASGKVTLVWSPSTEADLTGYHVYRGSSPYGPFTRVTASPLSAATFTETATAGQTVTYMVRTLTLEAVPGGSYYNFSQGAQLTHVVNGGSGSSGNPPPELAPFKLLWQIGKDDVPGTVPYDPYGEFSFENRIDDLAPGRVTRLPGDPLYSATANPDRDDDYYCVGVFPVGFNGLRAALNVPKQEPYTAWERALSNADKTNRVHFMLGANDVNPASRLRLNFELPTGGFRYGAPINRLGGGFGTHDLVVRFKNGKGVSTVIYSNRLERATRVSFEVPVSKVFATAGANSIEFIRVGPNAQSVAYWLVFDYVSLESAVPKSVTTLAGVQSLAARAAAASSVGLRLSGGPILSRSGAGSSSPVAGGGIVQEVVMSGGQRYLSLTYSKPEPAPADVVYRVEASGNLLDWSESGLVPMGSVLEGEFRKVTVRDSIPLSTTPSRYMRLRIENLDAEGGDSVEIPSGDAPQ
ncbi:MAG: hypothetical protein JNL10_14145 [Verrucomicrobiales bacterium]|nr:hypothetical protein [Verrucomicrobiales bacterium]